MYSLLRPLLFRRDAETVHERVLALLAHLSASPGGLALLAHWASPPPAILKQHVWRLPFASPIGLAAGFDKDARAIPALAALGFGFIEVGTVTPRPQPGNLRPRLFRLPEDHALINRLGFNNGGAEALVRRLAADWLQRRVPVGVNLGKNKDTPLDQALTDYAAGLDAAYPVADYLVVNVSSPNTPGLRQLQDRAALTALLTALVTRRDTLARQGPDPIPLLVKVAPDLTDRQLADVAAAGEEAGIDGYIATNTTVTRPGLRDLRAAEQGGLSGRPLAPLARRVLAQLFLLTGGKKPLIGVGGIDSGAEAYARIRAGASLLQIYTGFIYGGPGFPTSLAAAVAAALARDGFSSITEAVGVDAARVAAAVPGAGEPLGPGPG